MPGQLELAEKQSRYERSLKKAAGRNAMEKPVLVVMAAGMGSHYKGLKQLDP